MVATGRSAVLRRAGSLLSLLAFEVAAVVVLTRLGGVAELRIPWHSLTPWLLNSPVEDVLAAILRSIALLITWWLLGSTVLYLVASLTRVPSAIRAVRWLTLPMVRRATDHALALTLATSLMGGGTGTGVAGAAQVAVMAPQRPGPVAAEQQPNAETAGPLGYAPSPAGPAPQEAPARAARLPRYVPQPAGLQAQQTETTSGRPDYIPRPAGPPGAQPRPTSTSSTEPTTTTERAPTSITAPPGTEPPTSTNPLPTTPPTSTNPRSTTAPSTTAPTGTPTTTTPPLSTAPPATASPPGAGTAPSTTAYVPRPAGPPSTTAPRSTAPRSTRPTAPPKTTAPGATPPTTSPPTNTAPPGGGQQPTPSPQPPGEQPARSHRVARGDSLWTISRDHLAAATNRRPSDLSDHEIASYWLRVIAVNRSALRSGDPDLIFPGELIMFPPVSG